MKNYKYLLLVSTCLLFNNSSHATELDLTFKPNQSPFGIHISDTHTPVGLKPISNLKGIKLAAVCALGSGGCDGMGFNAGDNDMNLDNNAQCKDEGFVTSCPSGYVPDASQKCPYNNSFFKCRVCSHSCSSGSLAYCSSDQIETANAKNDCNETCYTCRAKTCEEGGYTSSINSCQKASTVSFAGKTCYTSVAGKTCTDGGYVAAIPNNQVGQSTSYCGNTCYYNIRTPACSEGGHRDNVPVNQVCTTTPYYGQNCYSGCYTPSCAQGGYVSACPANQVGTSVNHYGQTCYKDCYQPACSAGGYVDSCPANQIGTAVSHYGRTCYSGCYQPACSAGGYVDSCPANQIGTTVSYSGRTCYSGCYQPTCSQGGYYDSIPAHETCTFVSYYGRTCYKDCRIDAPIYVTCSSNSDCAGNGMKVCKNPGKDSSYCSCYGVEYSSSAGWTCSGICKAACSGNPTLSECSLKCSQ